MKIVSTLHPMHPGEMLREEFLKPMRLTPYRVAKACGVPRTRIERIAREELGITADTVLRLAKFFGTAGLPTSVRFFWTSGASKMRFTSAASLSTMSAACRRREQPVPRRGLEPSQRLGDRWNLGRRALR